METRRVYQFSGQPSYTQTHKYDGLVYVFSRYVSNRAFGMTLGAVLEIEFNPSECRPAATGTYTRMEQYSAADHVEHYEL